MRSKVLQTKASGQYVLEQLLGVLRSGQGIFAAVMEVLDDFLPEEILWRTKNAMSDATSVKSGWKEYLKSYCESQVTDSRFESRQEIYPYCTPQTKEDMYYRELFTRHKYTANTIPYKWMSSWCDPNCTDSSASVIDVFEEDKIE